MLLFLKSWRRNSVRRLLSLTSWECGWKKCTKISTCSIDDSLYQRAPMIWAINQAFFFFLIDIDNGWLSNVPKMQDNQIPESRHGPDGECLWPCTLRVLRGTSLRQRYAYFSFFKFSVGGSFEYQAFSQALELARNASVHSEGTILEFSSLRIPLLIKRLISERGFLKSSTNDRKISPHYESTMIISKR